eukprot:6443637-Amphidinium_carterae.1
MVIKSWVGRQVGRWDVVVVAGLLVSTMCTLRTQGWNNSVSGSKLCINAACIRVNAHNLLLLLRGGYLCRLRDNVSWSMGSAMQW